MKVSFLACFCLSCTFLWSQPGAKKSPEILVITNVNVIDTRDGSYQPKMTVVIKNDKIEAVARFAMIASSPNTRVVNATGKYLIPGLWDMHVHGGGDVASGWSERELDAFYVANGVTGVREMEGDVLGETQSQGGELGPIRPHVFFAHQFLGENKNASKLLTVSIPTSSETPANEIKSVEQLSGVMLACSSHENELREQAAMALSSRDEAAYASLAASARDTYDPSKAGNLFAQFSEHGTRMVPALVWSQTRANLSAYSNDDSTLKFVPASVRKSWALEETHHGSSGELEEARRVAARDVELVGAMHRAGVQFMSGTDSPAPYVIPGYSLHQELQWLVKSGFSPAQALQAATIDPATFLVELDKYGVAEKGHVADLVLLDANPLEDIGNTKKIAAVILAGKYYSRKDLEKLLEAAK